MRLSGTSTKLDRLIVVPPFCLSLLVIVTTRAQIYIVHRNANRPWIQVYCVYKKNSGTKCSFRGRMPWSDKGPDNGLMNHVQVSTAITCRHGAVSA